MPTIVTRTESSELRRENPTWKVRQTVDHAEISRWILLYYSGDEGAFNTFKNSLQRSSNEVGVRLCAPKVFKIDRMEYQALEDALFRMEKRIIDDCQLIVVLLPNRLTKDYDRVKGLLKETSSAPIISQVVRSATTSKNNLNTISQNIAM